MSNMTMIRFEITKDEEIRYISHLDYARAVERAIRRAQIPALYSEGFNPHIKLAFASALAVGMTSEAEYMDLELRHEMQTAVVLDMLKDKLPQGIRVLKAKKIHGKVPKLMAVVNQASYKVTIPQTALNSVSVLKDKVKHFSTLPKFIYQRHTPKGVRDINIKEFIDEITLREQLTEVILDIVIKITPTGSVKPLEVIDALCKPDINIDLAKVFATRTGLFVMKDGIRMTPLDAGEEKVWLRK